MKKEMTVETNDEAVDLGRRSMMSRLGLVASVAIAAPVLMTMSTSALADHKEIERGSEKAQKCNANSNANERAEKETCPDDGPWTPTENDSGW